MITKDGYRLLSGDKCYVSVYDPEGNISPEYREALYRDGLARDMGWDFSIESIEAEGCFEVAEVWKHKPLQEPNP